MSKPGIFRLQAIQQQKAEWQGKALLLRGFPPVLMALLCGLFIIALTSFLLFSSYTRRIEVKGELISLPHAVNIYTPQQGYITKTFVKAGERVKNGDPLYRLNISRETASGNVSLETLNVIRRQIDNINQIIDKLRSNKQETIANLKEQLAQYQDNARQTKSLLASAYQGVLTMQRGMSSYESYHHKGLITTDQLNSQRFMFYQQQSGYQSLNSQAIQQDVQISQLKSQILTRAAEFDNNITQNIYQRNELQRNLIESDASDSIIITSRSSGRVDSLAYTEGQMVNNGAVLAQIQPMEKTRWSMILWLPDSSLPYVKINDKVNIRYTAFPSEKYGQFPGKIASISYIPASREEMSNYNSAPDPQTANGENYYKVILTLNHTDISDRGKKLDLSGGLQAKTIVFLDNRKLWQWMFEPFYNIKDSVTGQVNG